MQPEDASLCFGAGIAAFMLGQDDVAQSRFECVLAINPGFLPAAVWLGDLHYRAGRCPRRSRSTKQPHSARGWPATSSSTR